jgi:hypothetical protein
MTHPSDIAGLSDLLDDLREGPFSFLDARTKMHRAAATLDSLTARVKEADEACQRLCREHGFATGHGDSVADMIDEISAQIRKMIYVPGSWHCPKCKFTLLQSNLNAQDGTVTARDTPGDKCPNCNSPLWRCTWKNDSFEMQERAVEQMERALRAEQQRDEAQRDAERYRFLRGRDLDTIHNGGVFAGMTPQNIILNEGDLDREVDAAIRRLASGPEGGSVEMGD